MQRFIRWTSDVAALLRLAGVVVLGGVAAFGWLVRSGDGSWRDNVTSATLIALAPLVFAFPSLFRRHHERIGNESQTLRRLRNSGAI